MHLYPGSATTLKQAAILLFLMKQTSAHTHTHTLTHTQCESWITALLRRIKTHLYPPTQLAGILLHITRAHVKTTERPGAAS